MRKILSVMLILALIVLPVAAIADDVIAKVTGADAANVYAEAKADSNVLMTLASGEDRLFAEETSTDDNGVVWYYIWINNDFEDAGWVSCESATLSDGTVDGLGYDPDMIGEMKVLSDDTLVVDPYQQTATVKVAKDAVVCGMGYTVDADDGNTWIKVGNGEGEEGWMKVQNLEKLEEEEAVELR